MTVPRSEYGVIWVRSRAWSTPNDTAGIRTLLAQLQPTPPTLIVLEPTGGYELALVSALAAAGLAVAVVNAHQVRDFAKATGQLAKTDQLDAATLSLFAERVRPEPRPLADEAQQALDALLTRRRQLVDMLTAERNRLGQSFGHAAKPVKHSLTAHIAYLEREQRMADAALGRAIRESPVWREQEDLLRSVPGVGRVLATRLLAQLSELGHLSHKQIAKLVGVAPMNRDSGTLRGRRLVFGGRTSVRAVLYMGRSSARARTPCCARTTSASSRRASRRSSPSRRACENSWSSSTRWSKPARAGTPPRHSLMLDNTDSC